MANGMSLRNLLLLAWRDSRGSRARLALFAAAFVAGLAALTMALVLRSAIAATIEEQARALLGADISVLSKRDGAVALPAAVAPSGVAREIRFRSMVRFPNGATRLVQVRALEAGMPFYGAVETKPADRWAQLNRHPNRTLIDESLALQTGATVGDVVTVGTANFTIDGIVTAIPGSANVSTAVAPRLYLPYSGAAATGLLGRGSVVDYYTHLEVALPQRASAEAALRRDLPADVVLETVAERAQQLGSVSDNVTLFISITGLVILGLGGIGAAMSLSFYLRGKLPEAALLKCLGLQANHVVLIYAVQVGVVGLLAAGLGVVGGVGLSRVAIAALARFAATPIQTEIAWTVLAAPLCLGIAVMIIAAVPGIVGVRRVPGFMLLKGEMTNGPTGHWALVATLVYGVIVVTVALVGQSLLRSALVGLLILVALGVLLGLSAIAERLARAVGRRISYFPVRHGMLSIARPQNATRALIVAFALTITGAGTLLISEHLLQRRIDSVMLENTANLFVYDVQQDEAAQVRAVLAQHEAELVEEVPIVLMRIAAIKGQSTSAILSDRNSSIPGWTLKRDYWSSYRRELATNEAIVAGSWVPEVPADTKVIPISIEDRLANRLGLGLGDRLTFSIQGVSLETVVASIRKIYWEQMRRNAFIVFPAGVLEEAPKFLFLTARAHAPEQSAAVQQALAAQFPGVSMVDLRAAVASVAGYLAEIAGALRVLVLIVLCTALTVLIATVVSSREARSRESQMLRALGATRWQRRTIVQTEYLTLAVVGTLLGLGLSIGAGSLLNISVFHLDFSLPWGALFGVCGGLVLVVAVLGVLGGQRRG